MPLILLFRTWCMRHQAHLMSKKTLANLSHGNYWNSLAKVINTWRGSGNSLKLFKAYAARFGLERAEQVAKTPPPRPLAGRWGAADKSEERLLLCGRAEFPLVFDDAFPKRRAGQAAPGEGEGQEQLVQLGELDPGAEGMRNNGAGGSGKPQRRSGARLSGSACSSPMFQGSPRHTWRIG